MFQEFSDSLAHIVQFTLGSEVDWYLDDFFFVQLAKSQCDNQVNVFLAICTEINFPVSPDKTFWGSQIMVFLGLLLNTVKQIVTIPEAKRNKARDSIDKILRSKKIKVLELQKLTGFLNFLCKAIVPGRAFTRRMYAKYRKMKQHHHIKVDDELKMDCQMWNEFLEDPECVSRPFVDFSLVLSASELFLTSDASLNEHLGFGAFFMREINGVKIASWISQRWPNKFIRASKISIEVAELIGVTAAIALWAPELANQRVIIRCDNQAVVYMINKASSSCKKCMFLLRLITMICMKTNTRFFCKYIDTKANLFSDLLSRTKIDKFFQVAPTFTSRVPEALPGEIWPFHPILWEEQETK